MDNPTQTYSEWYASQLERSEQLIDSVEEARTAIVPVVQDLSRTALAVLQDTLPFMLTQDLSPAQHRAAFLVGSGVELEEAAKMISLPYSTLLRWRQESADFRRSVTYYRGLKTEELQGKLIRNIEVLIDDPALDEKAKVSLLGVAQRLVSEHGRERLAQAQIMVQIESLNRQGEGAPRPTGLSYAPQIVDADFTVLEDGGEPAP